MFSIANKNTFDEMNYEFIFKKITGLLKRTAKKNNVEIFRVTSGPRKVENATKLLTNALIHISKQHHVKDRRSCQNCEFKKTEHCK